MATAPTQSAARGEITLQPSYFTSSLYVDPLREDVSDLIDRFAAQYAQSSSQPFTLFKSVWNELGWCWIHFRVFDPRARDSFINVTERLFVGVLGRLLPPFRILMFTLRAHRRDRRTPYKNCMPLCTLYVPLNATFGNGTCIALRETPKCTYR